MEKRKRIAMAIACGIVTMAIACGDGRETADNEAVCKLTQEMIKNRNSECTADAEIDLKCSAWGDYNCDLRAFFKCLQGSYECKDGMLQAKEPELADCETVANCG